MSASECRCQQLLETKRLPNELSIDQSIYLSIYIYLSAYGNLPHRAQGRCGVPGGSLREFLGCPWGVSGSSLGIPRELLGVHGGCLGGPWELPGGPWGGSGSVGVSGEVSGNPWVGLGGSLGCPWGCLGGFLGSLGESLGSPWGSLGYPWGVPAGCVLVCPLGRAPRGRPGGVTGAPGDSPETQNLIKRCACA